MTIFDSIPRDRSDPPHQHETAFAYLNRSGRAEADRVRQLVDAWLDRYPAGHRDGLVARLRSTIDDQHRSAFFELFTHELIITRGHRVIAIEPPLAHSPRSPDFLIESGERQRLYLECVIATGRSQQEIAALARLNQALAAVDQMPSPAHFLDLSVDGLPTAPISINRMKRALRAWIARLPDDDTAMEAAPFVHEEHGVRITLRAYTRHNRERVGRAIGVRHFPVRQLPDGSTTHMEGRNPDGIWCGPSGARRKGLSAVLSTEQVDPWNFAVREGRLIRNPWATVPLPPFDLGVDDYHPENGRYRITEGVKMGKIFRLPEGWPE